jgi:hypothetical protein
MRGICTWPVLGKLVVGVGLLGILIVCARENVRHAPIHFSTIAQAKEFFLRQGLFCHDGTKGKNAFGNYFVASHPIDFDSLQMIINRRNCGMTPAWRGILWICQLHRGNNGWIVITDSVDGNCRVWGDVLVAGDEELMDRIEELFRNDRQD